MHDPDLTTALAAALWGVLYRGIDDEIIQDWERNLDDAKEWYIAPNEFAAAILADPAFRSALTAALAEALHESGCRAGSVCGRWRHKARAESIVAHMLPEAE